MNYNKPEVNTLGEAKSVIETLVIKPPFNHVESPTTRCGPAYDLDE